MKSPFFLTILALAVGLSGCSSSGIQRAEELELEPQSQYDQRIQDSLSAEQKYSEAQMIYQRKMNDFHAQIDALERQSKALEQGLSNAAFENGYDVRPASTAEAERISDYQDAARRSQARIARSDADARVKKALLENQRDSDVLAAEQRAATQIASLESSFLEEQKDAKLAFDELVSRERQRLTDLEANIEKRRQEAIARVQVSLDTEKTLITARARTQIAGVESASVIEKASVIAPVVTGRKVYTDEQPKLSRALADAGRHSDRPKPLVAEVKSKPLTVAEFKPHLAEPKKPLPEDLEVVLAGGTVASSSSAGAPVLEVQKTREVFDVIYTYGDENSWTKFQNYLKAWGVSDFSVSHSSKQGKWYIFAGRFHDEASAARRVDDLNRRTSTNHAKVIRKDLPL
ncbi:hypothetical protein [Stutzerimonas stutzeri]|uniref:hypothetical protein n=1 Tax=Stutzerimonas stutzeri TaxID=316 RepID=UPI001BCF297A|nr:hypothetical protein [Stutzerimonas stutzeri]